MLFYIQFCIFNEISAMLSSSKLDKCDLNSMHLKYHNKVHHFHPSKGKFRLWV